MIDFQNQLINQTDKFQIQTIEQTNNSKNLSNELKNTLPYIIQKLNIIISSLNDFQFKHLSFYTNLKDKVEHYKERITTTFRNLQNNIRNPQF